LSGIVSRRAIGPGDLAFLARVYSSTRTEELAVVDWPQAQIDAFLQQQFDAQHAWYQEHYVGASFEVVLVDGEPAGRLYVARWKEELRLVDVALLPEYRRRGIGRALVEDVMDEARGVGKAVRIHVERWNPALRLYERLGFKLAEDRGVYLFLEWRAR
jgi:GNAT superfamily N-acetyltransferase